MGFLEDLGYEVVKRKVKVAKAKKTFRSSLLNYIDKEIELAINQNLELGFNKVKDDNSKKVKEIRMWGDVIDGKRRMTLKGMNRKLYSSHTSANEGGDYQFNNTDSKSVIKEMKDIRDNIAKSEEGSLTFYYVKKKKGESKQIIEVKV